MINNSDACCSFPADDGLLTVDGGSDGFFGPVVLVLSRREHYAAVNQLKTAIFPCGDRIQRDALMATSGSLDRLTLMLGPWSP